MNFEYDSVYTLRFNVSSGEFHTVDVQIDTIRYNQLVYQAVLAVWGFISNFTLIIGLLLAGDVRRLVISFHIINLSVTEALLCVITLPFAAYQDAGRWDLGQPMCEAWMLTDVMFNCTLSFIIVVMNVDRLMLVVDVKKYVRRMKVIMLILMVITPWFLSAVVVLVVWVRGRLYLPPYPGLCMYAIHKDFAKVSPFITFFIPALFILTLTLATLVMIMLYPLNRQRINHSQPFNDSGQTQLPYPYRERASLFSVCLINFFFLSLNFPTNCESLLVAFCEGECMPAASNRPHIFFLLGVSFIGLSPILWLAYYEVRHAVCNIPRNLMKRF